MEALNLAGSTVVFTRVDGDQFDFDSVSPANNSMPDFTYSSPENWASRVTINRQTNDVVMQSIEIDLTFDHLTRDLGWGVSTISNLFPVVAQSPMITLKVPVGSQWTILSF